MHRQKGEIGLTVAFFLIAASLVSTVAVNTIKNFDTRKKAAELYATPLLNVAKPSPSPAYTCGELCLNTYRTACVSIGTDASGSNGKIWISENVSAEKRYPDYQCREIVGSCTTPISWLSNGITCSSSDGTSARAQWTKCRCQLPVAASTPTCAGGYAQPATTDQTTGILKVYAKGVANVTNLYFATWSAEGTGNKGQDDIVWYKGSDMDGGLWTAAIDLSKHPGLGTIYSDIWVSNASYGNTYCGSAAFTRVAPPTVTPAEPMIPKLNVSGPTPGTTLRKIEIGVSHPSGMESLGRVVVINLLPPNANLAEKLYVMNAVHESKQGILQDFGDARRLAQSGTSGSKVVVWGVERWSGDIAAYVGYATRNTTDYVDIVDLLPEDATITEKTSILNLTYTSNRPLLQKADEARFLVKPGKPGSKVIVWDAARWPGDIVSYLGVPVELKMMPTGPTKTPIPTSIAKITVTPTRTPTRILPTLTPTITRTPSITPIRTPTVTPTVAGPSSTPTPTFSPGACQINFVNSWGRNGTGDGYFQTPVGITFDKGDKNLIIVDRVGSYRVQKYSRNAGLIKTWDFSGNGTPNASSYSRLYTYVAETTSNRIRRFNDDKSVNTTFGSGGSNGLSSPYGVGVKLDASNKAEFVYVSDTNNNRIRKYDSTGNYQSDIGVSTLSSPKGITTDSSGNIYVADSGNSQIRKFSSAGSLLLSFGSGTLNNPSGIVLDSTGNIYVSDTGNNQVRKFNPSGTLVLSFGGSGSAYGKFNSPQGIVLDDSENIYVADSGNNRIQKFSCLSTPSTQADLDVTYIERTSNAPNPTKYFRYGNGHDTLQKAPLAGESVTFTAHVKNKGGITSASSITYKWFVNGTPVPATTPGGSGTLSAIAPLGETSVTLNLNWPNPLPSPADFPKIKFQINPTSGQDRFSDNNNVEDRYNAQAISIYVEQTAYNEMDARLNVMGTFSFEDYVRRQVKELNDGIIYRGGLERVRLDKIQVLPDGAVFPSDQVSDATWQYKKSDWFDGANVNRASQEVGVIDKGLVHELFHGIGIGEEYFLNFDMNNHDTNKVVENDECADPVCVPNDPSATYACKHCIYYNPYNGGVMNGMAGGGAGDTIPAMYTVKALDQDIGKRKGFGACYFYDIPTNNKIIFLQKDGSTPLTYTTNVKVYQDYWTVPFDIHDVPNPSPNTDPIQDEDITTGQLNLVNRTASLDGDCTRTGHNRRNNPFGELHRQPKNGILVMRMYNNEEGVDYAWIDVSEFNKAYWDGNTTNATYYIKTKYGPSGEGMSAQNLGIPFQSPTPTKKPVPAPTKKPSAWSNFWNKMIFRRRL